MADPMVGIGLPVYNGENYLTEAVDSILAQTFGDFQLVIVDNASDDATEAIARAYAARDRRVSYVRNPENIGAAGNYTRAFELTTGPLFKWAAHDDRLCPTYLERCVEVLFRDPSVVLCHTRTRTIDARGEPLVSWQAEPALSAPEAHVRFGTALGLAETYLVWGLMRREAVGRTGLLGPFVGHDRPFLSAMSLLGRFVEVPEELFEAREHEKRSVYAYDWRQPRQAIAWYDPSKAGRVVFPAWRLLSEHGKGLARARLPLSERLRCGSVYVRRAIRQRRHLLQDLVVAGTGDTGRTWLMRIEKAARNLHAAVPAGSTVILVDDQQLETEIFADRTVWPFIEHNGMYWGPPQDDDHAIRELERLRGAGADFLVFAEPSFWWFDHYRTFYETVCRRFACLLRTDGFIVYDLRAANRS